MRAGLTGLVLLAAALIAPVSDAQPNRVRNSAPVAATAPTPANPSRTYDQPMDALITADLDYLVTDARSAFTGGDHGLARGMLVFLDDMAGNHIDRARQTLEAMPQGLEGEGADFFEAFLLLSEGQTARAVERAHGSADALPSPLPELMRALVYEGAGDLPHAADAYTQIIATLDVRPPPEGEPQSVEDLQRILSATRTTHTLYRAALVQHRLRHRDEAQRLYQLVDTLAPNSPDVEANLVRLARGQPPLEPALNPQRALGRWLTFLSDYMGNTEGLAAVLTAEGPIEGLSSPSAAMFLQFALLLDPSADDWRLGAASQLISAEGLDGAERLLAPIRADAPYGAEAELMRASIQVRRHNDEAAVTAARRALTLAHDRWTIYASVGDVYRAVGRADEATSAFDRALALAHTEKDRSDVLRSRAYAHRFAGDLPDAVADARAALAMHRDDDTRLMFVSILMDDPQAWQDGVTEARALFSEQPNSVTRLNTLGYALIQKPEGLEEGYRLLWRGFLLGDHDYAVIDSLGWAYYLHGAFDQARALVERANDLSGADKNPEVLDHLGDIYWRLQRPDDARTAWRQALEWRPDAIRRRALEAKLSGGLTAPAPAVRELPRVEIPNQSRDET